MLLLKEDLDLAMADNTKEYKVIFNERIFTSSEVVVLNGGAITKKE